MKKIILSIAFLLIAGVYASGKAPQYRSLRVQGMGNAFVAVADNKDALYYNPAGLNLIKNYYNFEKNPDMGYMPRNNGTFTLFSIVSELPVGGANDILSVCGNRSEFWDAFFFKFNKFGKIKWCQELIDELQSDNSDLDTIGQKLLKFDNKELFKLSAQVNFLEYATHNFGFSIWANTSNLSPYIDMGILFPSIGYDTVTIDLAIQTAIAFSPIDKWSVGIGIKGVQRSLEPGSAVYIKYNEDAPLEASGYQDSLKSILDTLENLKDIIEPGDLIKFSKYNLALDLGVLYQIHRQIRLGASLRDIYFSKLNGESITPNLSLGAMASPMILQSNSLWERKINFALDYVDVLNDNLLDMPLSHLNFGTEIEQVIVPSPTRDMSFWPRLGFSVLGGAVGGTIGYFVGRNFPIGDAGPFVVGSLIGIGTGFVIGNNYGFGNDFLRTSVGGGFSGGYWSATGALKISFFGIRVASWAEEMGFRTGQKENRHYMIEISSTF